MKRDMTLVREILSYVEAQPAGKPIRALETSCDDINTLAEHVGIMIENGLLDGEVFGDSEQGWGFIIHKLTWDGHDFLSTVKNDRVWKKVLVKIKEMGTDFTLDIVKELAKSYLKQEIGMP
jgi:hypothetical protein